MTTHRSCGARNSTTSRTAPTPLLLPHRRPEHAAKVSPELQAGLALVDDDWADRLAEIAPQPKTAPVLHLHRLLTAAHAALDVAEMREVA